MELQKHKRYKFSGFTLVELIVVISILAILGTISFIQLQGFSGSARDSVRISNLTNLKKWLDFFQIKNWSYPKPENSITLFMSGVNIAYQWFAKEQTITIAKLSPGGNLDPNNPNIYATYTTTANGIKMQLMTFLEDKNSFVSFLTPATFADVWSDYSTRIPYVIGDKICILVDSWSLVPIQNTNTGIFDIPTTFTWYTAYCDNKTKGSGSGGVLWSIFMENSVIYNTGWISSSPIVPLATCWNTTDFSKITLDCPVWCSMVGTICGGWLLAWTNLIVSRSWCNWSGTICDGSMDSFWTAWKTSSSWTPWADSSSDWFANSLALTSTPALKSQHPAASYCSDMSVNSHNDWYLPSNDEIDKFRLWKDAGILWGWATYYNTYWSSTQVYSDKPFSWNIGWNNITSHWDFTDIGPRVRCVRKTDGCWSAARTYPSSNNGSDFWETDSFCAPWKTLSSTTPIFPIPWNNTWWLCAWWGQESTCTATRLPTPVAACWNITDFSKITLDCPVWCSAIGTICGGWLIAWTNLIVSRSWCNWSGTVCDGSTDSFWAVWKTTSSWSLGSDSSSDWFTNTLALTSTQTLKNQHPAASYCSDMSTNNYNDWYLPSNDEIDKYRLWKNAGTLSWWASGVAYWSSTQIGTGKPFTWNIGWNNVSSYWDFTDTMPKVRCARKY